MQTIRPARFILEVIRYISCPLPNMDPLIEKEDPLVVADPVQDPPVVADDVSFHASLMQLFHSEQETQDELNSARLTCYHFVRVPRLPTLPAALTQIFLCLLQIVL